jgi:hypothetical protein
MKKVLLVLVLALGLTGCEREVNVDITVPPCEDGGCEGAIVNLAPQARGPVDRDGMYAWIDVITVVATDDQSVNYGDVFTLVDDNSGADGFFLATVPVNEIIDFSASSTSKDDGAGKFLQFTGNPDNLTGFVGRMPYAEYATDTPVSQYIEQGDNTVFLQMNTDHGRLISSFQLAEDLQYNNPNNGNLPMYYLAVKRGGETMTATGESGVVAYWNDVNSVGGVTQTFTVEIHNYETGALLDTRTVTETFVASTSITNKYVVGLGFVEDSSVEVIFSWQPWTETEGDDETDTTSPNGLDCSSCGTVTNWSPNGSYALTGDTILNDVNLVVAGDLNLNGHTLTVTCGSVTVSGNFNGQGTIIVAGDLTVTGATQPNGGLTIYANECF